MRKGFGFMMTLVIAAMVMMALPKTLSDRINPLVQVQEIYAMVDQLGMEADGGGYLYRLNGYTPSGDKATVVLEVQGQLDRRALVRMEAKGAYVASWTVVDVEELPASARTRLHQG
ncbi:YxeA family protein [Paenibacillus sp. IB182496]|uniref:YxeA family protein n=1 Tax=Paenibacillus sabuli TaxID=2772509 RepID=A0A927GT54_9BACL|nr:YxeA family protein [Paenibacillus sabuli]MBD2846735.1 YxeA family protein [Paenibacillus sabuli]